MKLKILSEEKFVLDDKILSLEWDYAVPFTARIALNEFDVALEDPNLMNRKGSGFQPHKLQYYIDKNYLSVVLDSNKLIELNNNNSISVPSDFHDDDNFVEDMLAIIVISKDTYAIEHGGQPGGLAGIEIVIRLSTVAKLQQILQQCNVRFTEYMKKIGYL